MKATNLIPKFLIGAAILGLSIAGGCKKENKTAVDDPSADAQQVAQTEDQSTSLDNAAAESMTNNAVARLTSENSELSGGCATVVRDSAASTITITFDNCMGPHGHIRNGQIVIHYTGGGYWTVGASWDMTFTNFSLDGNPVTGTRHVVNVGPASNGMTWNITADMRITNSDGSYRTWTSTRTRKITSGYGDSLIYNNVYVINGTASHYNSHNNRTCSITISNLTRDLSCPWITAGTVTAVPSDGHPTRVIDFGSGNCDNIATVTCNGQTHTIYLHIH